MSRRGKNGLTGLEGCGTEQHVNLKVWPRDCFVVDAGYRRGNRIVICRTKPGQPEVSVGRADSKRTLGFTVSRGTDHKLLTAFVLDRDQVIALRDHLDYQLPRLKRRRRRKSRA
jgi:hypothetical protein